MAPATLLFLLRFLWRSRRIQYQYHRQPSHLCFRVETAIAEHDAELAWLKGAYLSAAWDHGPSRARRDMDKGARAIFELLNCWLFLGIVAFPPGI